MIENEVIVRLESMVERLNGVLEQNLLSEYKKQQIRISSKGKAIDKLLKLDPLLNNLARARTAKELLSSAVSNTNNHLANTVLSPREYLHAACIVYELLCTLSASDAKRVYCGVEIEPALKEL